MDYLNRAINYETLIKLSKKGDATIFPLFEKMQENGIDIDTPLVYDPLTWSNIIGVSEYELQEAFRHVRGCFSYLPKKTVIICPDSPLWPIGLKKVPFLYLHGKIDLLNKTGISVVGTRSPSKRGIELAQEVVLNAGKNKLAIFSGLALGIDGASHISSLKNCYDSIAVIGTPLNKCYPPKHERLQTFIADEGLLVSQISPSRTQQRWFFLIRNQLMSFLSKATVVIEDRDGGGAVQQAGYAIKQGRRAFTFQEVLENRSILWPRKIEGLEIAKDPVNLISKILELKKIEKKLPKPVQPELF